MVVTAVLYIISNAITRNTYADMSREELQNNVLLGQEMLADYAQEKLSQEQLQQMLNPRINPDGVFFLLTDPKGDVLAYSEYGRQ